MKIRDIVELAAVLLQNNELINTNVFWHKETDIGKTIFFTVART